MTERPAPNYSDAERELRRVEEKEAHRTCIDCEHWLFDSGEPGWSEYTPGVDASSSCRRGHWTMDENTTEDGYRDHLRTARKCKDFEDYQESSQ